MKRTVLFIIGMSLSLMADFIRNDTTQIVTDSKTTLQWQDNADVQKTWTGAIAYCESLTIGSYDDWRLPNINELASIVDRSKDHPATDNTFQHVVFSNYWSSSTLAGLERYAWNIHFGYGSRSDSNKYSSFYVRCVRGGE